MSTSTTPSFTDNQKAGTFGHWSANLVKAFAEHKQTKAVVKTLQRARSYALETRAKVNAYEAPIFASFEFYNDLDASAGAPRTRLTKFDDLYLSTDEDACTKFYAACAKAHKDNGFKVPEDQCPALVAENEVIRLENALLIWATNHFNFDFTSTSLTLRARALKLLEGLV